MLRRFIMCLAAVLPLAAGVAHAQDAETDQDVRCLVVSFAMAGADDAAKKRAGAYAALYYLGRLDGHAPSTDLQAKLTDALKTASAASLAADGKTCGALLQSRGETLQKIGSNLQGAASGGAK